MIHPRPYELYVRFLVTKGLEDLIEVNKILGELSLCSISGQYFEKQQNLVHDHITGPISKQISNKKYEGDFLRWMTILEVNELWEIEPKFRTKDNASLRLIYDVNYDPKLRHSLNALILKGDTTPKDICQDLNGKFSYMLKDQHITLYQKFFWAINRMTRNGWKDYIRNCADDFEKSLLFLCLTEDRDTVRNFLELPSKADVLTAYQGLFIQSVQKAKHYLRITSQEANKEARAWIKCALEVGDKYKKYETGNIVDFGKTLQMEFDYITSDFPTPDEATCLELEKNNKRLELGEEGKKDDQ